MSTRLESPMSTQLNSRTGTDVFLKSDTDVESAVVPASLEQLTRPAARMKVDKLRRRIGELTRELKAVDRSSKVVMTLVIELHEGQAHRALGYKSWAEMVKSEGLQILNLGPDESTAAIRDMVASNFSTGGVSAVLGLAPTTGKRRVKRFIESQKGQGTVPDMVRSLDGIVRPRAKKSTNESDNAELPGQQTLNLTPDNWSPFDVDGFLSAIGASSEVDETVDQIVMVEAISQDLRLALDTLVAAEPEQRHASRVRKLLHHTEAIVDQHRMVASRWGISV